MKCFGKDDTFDPCPDAITTTTTSSNSNESGNSNDSIINNKAPNISKAIVNNEINDNGNQKNNNITITTTKSNNENDTNTNSKEVPKDECEEIENYLRSINQQYTDLIVYECSTNNYGQITIMYISSFFFYII